MVSIEATGPSAAGAAHSFWIGKFEVTHHQWVAVMGPASVRADRDTWPVYNVSFREAVEFAARVNRLTGKSFRLPTAEEWTQACAGQPVNAGTAFFGNADLGHPQFVGTLSPNNRRLYDMYGNVWEFCLDLDKGQPPIGYDTILERIRNNRETGTRQNLKGGGFNSDQTQCYGTIPVSSYEDRGISYGLRLAHDAPLTR
jgi:formylglycine-generating enzyme required for sulfatase activity